MRPLLTAATLGVLLVLAGCVGTGPAPVAAEDATAVELEATGGFEVESNDTPTATATPTPTATMSPTPTETDPWSKATEVEPGELYSGRTNDTRQFFAIGQNSTLVVEVTGLGEDGTADVWFTTEGEGPRPYHIEEDGTYRIDLSPPGKWGYRVEIYHVDAADITVSVERPN